MKWVSIFFKIAMVLAFIYIPLYAILWSCTQFNWVNDSNVRILYILAQLLSYLDFIITACLCTAVVWYIWDKVEEYDKLKSQPKEPE